MAKKAKAKKKFLQNRQDKRTGKKQLKPRRQPKMAKHDDDDDDKKKRAKQEEESRAKRSDESEQAKKEADRKAKQRASDEDPVTEQVHQRTDKGAEELMSTPERSPAPNPESPPGGEMIGEPTQLVPHTDEDDEALKEQRPTNPGPGERQRLTDEDRQR
jgi:hypothetical protein